MERSEDLWTLKDVSFEVKQGEVVGTLAPAVTRCHRPQRRGDTCACAAAAAVPGAAGHAGESTLLKILSRITEPTSGRAETCGGSVASLLDAARDAGSQSEPELTRGASELAAWLTPC